MYLPEGESRRNNVFIGRLWVQPLFAVSEVKIKDPENFLEPPKYPLYWRALYVRIIKDNGLSTSTLMSLLIKEGKYPENADDASL